MFFISFSDLQTEMEERKKSRLEILLIEEIFAVQLPIQFKIGLACFL